MSQLTTMPRPSMGAPTAAPLTRLTRRAKAAIVVQFILKEGADVPLSALPEDLQMQLTHLLGEMRYIHQQTMRVMPESW